MCRDHRGLFGSTISIKSAKALFPPVGVQVMVLLYGSRRCRLRRMSLLVRLA